MVRSEQWSDGGFLVYISLTDLIRRIVYINKNWGGTKSSVPRFLMGPRCAYCEIAKSIVLRDCRVSG